MTILEASLPQFTERHLKVAADYMAPGKREGVYALPKKIPWIQLKGFWLQRAGFEVNDTICVRIIKGCLVITAAKKIPGHTGDLQAQPLLEAPHFGA